jgi:hypothetical protein
VSLLICVAEANVRVNQTTKGSDGVSLALHLLNALNRVLSLEYVCDASCSASLLTCHDRLERIQIAQSLRSCTGSSNRRLERSE